MSQAIKNADFQFPNQKGVYHGKVRDVYTIGANHLVMVASDRISAFDHILPKEIPFKGQVLNQIASISLAATVDIVPNWVLAVPDENVTVGRRCETFKVEMVIRGYLCGHAWREYKLGKRILCGVVMPEGMKENERFPEPIITPATKAEEGHDEDISRGEIILQKVISETDYLQLEGYTRKLFQRGTEIAAERDLILVDTKYEFGKVGDTIYLIDEIHTPDSSRYFYAKGFQERQDKGEKQKQLSKEFVREWLIEEGFQGLEGQQMPEIPDDFVQLVSDRYIELYEKITGKTFIKADTTDVFDRINKNVTAALKQLN
ncbi:MAG: phosphoribosylaminoimidazolesuccinocarboxamide synthase [Vicingaceae bacterium]|jgi:phosphoribosylaminoimidazole-succinocarboxamide synthase